MSKTLEERLRDAKTALGKVDASTLNHAGKLAPEVEKQTTSGKTLHRAP